MLKNAPSCEYVIKEFIDFIGNYNLVAHNASFDRRFLDAESNRIGRTYDREFACSMLLARRVYPSASNHKLGTLVKYNEISTDGIYHRALADAEMAAYLWLRILNDIKNEYRLDNILFLLVQGLAKIPKNSIANYIKQRSDS